MPTSLTAAMEFEAKERVHRIHPVVELTLGSTVYRFAEKAVASESRGLYLPYVERIGDRQRFANVAEYTLETPRLRVSIYDADRVLQKEFGGPRRGAIRNATLRIFWLSQGGPENEIAAVDAYLDFSGAVTDYELTNRTYDFAATADVSALASQVRIPPWSEEDWPSAPENGIGAPNRVIYGQHSSAGITGSAGMIPATPLVEAANGNVDTWGLCHGAVSSVPRVFFDEVISTTWTVSRVARGKNYSTILTYTGGNPHPTKDSQITCDVDGITTLPSGSGTLITNPAEQIRHFLKTFVYGSGDARPLAAWPTETGVPVATAVFDAARQFFADRKWVGTLVASSGQTGREVFDAWCQSWNAAPFFSADWGVGARPRDNGERQLYYDDRHVAQRLQMAKGDLRLTTERQDPVTDLDVSYLLDETRNAYTRSLLMAWRRDGVAIVEQDFQMTHGKRSL